MALLLMNYGGYYARGSFELHDQIIISNNKVKVNSYYISFAPLPGIY